MQSEINLPLKGQQLIRNIEIYISNELSFTFPSILISECYYRVSIGMECCGDLSIIVWLVPYVYLVSFKRSNKAVAEAR